MRQFIASFLSVLGMSVLMSQPAIAQSGPAKPQGPGYEVISPPQPTASDKVEVIEVFSYGCIHCAEFQPYVDAWHARHDKNAIEFSYLPAPFNPLFSLFARGYYAANSLGVATKTHQRVFDAVFQQGKRVQSLDELANLYASFGVDRAKFLGAAQSFFVESQLRRADELIRAYRIDGTPTIVVAGKYRVSGDSAGGLDKVFPVVDKLVAQERKLKQAGGKK